MSLSRQTRSILSKTRVSRWLAPVFLVGVLSACAATFTNHGFVPPDAELEQILVGVDTRGTVEETIGPPSAAAGVTAR
jgi:hypothetical protein